MSFLFYFILLFRYFLHIQELNTRLTRGKIEIANMLLYHFSFNVIFLKVAYVNAILSNELSSLELFFVSPNNKVLSGNDTSKKIIIV